MKSAESANVLKKLRQGKLRSTLAIYALVAVVSGLSSVAGSYLTTKAQNKAMREDLREVTRVGEQIRSDIANTSWQSQRVWEEKKQIYVNLIKLLDQSNLNLIECEMRGHKLSLNAPDIPSDLLRALVRQKEIAYELSQSIAISSIFLSTAAREAVESYRSDVGPVSLNRDTGEVSSKLFASGNLGELCSSLRKRAMKSRDIIVAAARSDLTAGLALPESSK